MSEHLKFTISLKKIISVKFRCFMDWFCCFVGNVRLDMVTHLNIILIMSITINWRSVPLGSINAIHISPYNCKNTNLNFSRKCKKSIRVGSKHNNIFNRFKIVMDIDKVFLIWAPKSWQPPKPAAGIWNGGWAFAVRF